MALYIHKNGKNGKHQKFLNFFEKNKNPEAEYVITNKFIEEYNSLKKTLSELEERVKKLEDKKTT